MESDNKEVSLWKKACSTILICIGGFVILAHVLSSLAGMFIGKEIEVGVTVISIVLGLGILYGGAALWHRWRMAFGIFLTAIGVIFELDLAIPFRSHLPSFIAVKKAGLLVGLLSLISGICLIIYQHHRDKESRHYLCRHRQPEQARADAR